MTAAVELALGSQLWFDGDVWTITEFGRGSVTLSSGQSIRTATIATLARYAQPIVEPSPSPQDRELVPVVLGMLDSTAFAELERRADAVRSVLDDPCPARAIEAALSNTKRPSYPSRQRPCAGGYRVTASRASPVLQIRG